MFYLWNKVDKEHVLVFGTSEDFTIYCQLFTTEADAVQHLEKYKRRVVDYAILPFDTAQATINARMTLADGSAIQCVWHDEPWFRERIEINKCYARVDPEDPRMIRYYPDAKKLAAGITTVTTAGRFLTKYFSDVLDAKQIKYWAEKHKDSDTNKLDLRWAFTPAEIEAVYSMNARFSSCMQGSADSWKNHGHPTRVYGAGDLSLAYILHPEDRHTLIARALVWREKKRVGRMYGDDAMLRRALAQHGIKTKSNQVYYDTMEGARLLKIETTVQPGSDMYSIWINYPLDSEIRKLPMVCTPYIDGNACELEDDGDFLIIRNAREDNAAVKTFQYFGQSTSGFSFSRNKCKHCSGWTDDGEDVVYSSINADGELWCKDCKALHSFKCSLSNRRYNKDVYAPQYVYRDDTTYGIYGHTVNWTIYSTSYQRSEYSGTFWLREQMVTLATGEVWSKAERSRYAVQSAVDSTWHPQKSMVRVGYKKYVTRKQLKDWNSPELMPARAA